MIKTPRLSGKKIISTLKKAGFIQIRKKGSHCFLKHPDGRTTVIPIHANEIIGIGLFCKILADCELTDEDFLELIKK